MVWWKVEVKSHAVGGGNSLFGEEPEQRYAAGNDQVNDKETGYIYRRYK